ncbi:Predicted thiol-disulfide oxidoreductase YuxK, DCC family [Solimonas aquatica]|uniref:Predicted thiol-disulfide oxidoreductase YuxK, DCC family n=1 Tax=Solimonas aquatica TaxID=489703 RepID=A0A1H9E1E0_9GAMM|nr:DCC1-like thiol-disulfide oxidoreductase family protein [Solimonas aquatica]SEQ19559.1 Predicted thiol-disulfide oxidoreductase YuxK, DCC family [Solimonas aquatica]
MPPDLAQRYPRLAEIIGIDLRSLALLRILLGLVLLGNLLQLLPEAGLFFSDQGLLPRAALIATGEPWRLSLYLINGQTLVVLALLLLQLAGALMLTLGLRTRLASLISFALWISLLARNPALFAQGDVLVAALLFWLIFLPAGARASFDAALSRRAPPEENLHVSWASLGLLLQVASAYFFAGLLQTGAAWFGEFSALSEIFALDHLVLAPGRWLAQFPQLCAVLSAAIHVTLYLAPLLLFMPYALRPLRLGALLALACIEIATLLCLAMGNLPWVSLASLAAFVGGWLWDARAARPAEPAPQLFYDGDCAFCRKSVQVLRTVLLLPQLKLAPAQDTARTRTLMQANNSWVLIDSDEQAYLKWQVLLTLCRHSPLWRVLLPLLRLSRVQRAGDALYDFVARHRAGIGRLCAPLLAEPELCWQSPPRLLRFAAVAALLTLLWNLQGAQLLPAFVQRLLAPPLQLLHLDQRWDFFAPAPAREDGWWVVAAQRADGSQIDLRHPQRGSADFSKPERVVDEAANSRWRNLDAQLAEPQAVALRQSYAAWLCRQWQAGADDAQRILSLKLIYMLERRPESGGPATLEQQVMLRWDCVPEPAKALAP